MADSDYPKAKYKAVAPGEGDQIGKFNAGRHSYVSAVVADEEEEKALGEGWHDFPDMTDRPKAEPVVPVPEILEVKRGPGRPRKIETEE